MAYLIRKTFSIDPPLSGAHELLRMLQEKIAAARGVLEVSVVGHITGDALEGLQVDIVVDAGALAANGPAGHEERD
jgi:hypothetical protein